MSDLTDNRTTAKQQFADSFGALLLIDNGAETVREHREQRGITILNAFQEAWAHHKMFLDDDARSEFGRVIDAVHYYQHWASTGESVPRDS